MKSSIQKKVKLHQNVLTIRSAVPLKEEERQQIVELLIKKTEKYYDRVISIIDPRLICGVSVKSDSVGFEYSGRKIIDELVSSIKESQDVSVQVDEEMHQP